MAPTTTEQALDRHALVMTIWLTAGLIAATLFHYGLGEGGAMFLLGAFGIILAAFVGHIVVNVVFGTAFSPRELALGLVLYAAALIAFGLATLAQPEFRARAFAPVSAGFVLIFFGVAFYTVTTASMRGAFEAFDVIRSFRAPSRLSALRPGKGSE